MPVEFVCDGCGERREGSFNYQGNAMKPHKWYIRTDKETKKTFIACSRKCTDNLGGLHAPW